MSAVATPYAAPSAPRAAPWARRARVDAGVRTGALVVGVLGLLLVTYWWAAGGGITDLGGWETGLTSLGRLSGLLASDLLLVQVLLMARIPWLERSHGQDELSRRHRLVGFASFNLMLTHITLITIGYAAASHNGVLAQLWDLVANYPGILLASAGAALLVLVAVTSVRAARRRLRYESWHLLHLYAYLGVGLALPHQLWTGGDFLSSPLATVYWWSLWALAALAIVTFRIGTPLWRTLRHQLVVERVVDEGPDVVSVCMRGRHLEELPVSAGQFFIWRFLDRRPGWSRGHPWSLSAPVTDGRLRISVKDIGDGSAALRRLEPGTRVAIEGPFGRLTVDSRTRRRLVLIGAGVGVAPLRALAEELHYQPGEAVLIHRARSPEESLHAHELVDLGHRRGLRVVPLLGLRAPGRASWLPASWAHVSDAEALRRLAPHLLDSDVYVCGPDEWMTAVIAAVRAAGVPATQLHIERFSW
jgi:predicted ferric reductase